MKFVYDKKRREVVPKPEPRPTVMQDFLRMRADNKRVRAALRCTKTVLEEELKQIRCELAE